MATIIHTCSTILIRPNGICRYINSLIDLQRSLGHTVIFVTDSKPQQTINANQIIYTNQETTYIPNWKDGHVWLQVNYNVVDQISQSIKTVNNVDLVIAHDLHSYLAVSQLFNNGIFIQHESDVVNQDMRMSYLDDDYLKQQIDIVNTTNWHIGLCAPYSKFINPKKPLYTPPIFDIYESKNKTKDLGLMYIGDTSERKGAYEFMELAKKLNVIPTVISHETNAELFKNANVYTFTLDQKQDMFELMSRHKVAYLPSKQESLGLALIETLQFMPVVVDAKYSWNKHAESLGAIRANENDLESIINNLLNSNQTYDNILLQNFSQQSKNCWTNILSI